MRRFYCKCFPLPLTNHDSFLHWVWPSSFYSFLLCHDNTGTSVVSFHVRRCDSATLQPSHVLHHILRPSHFASGTSAVYYLLSFILVIQPTTVNHFFLSYFRLYWPHLLVVFSSAGSLQRVPMFSLALVIILLKRTRFRLPLLGDYLYFLFVSTPLLGDIRFHTRPG